MTKAEKLARIPIEKVMTKDTSIEDLRSMVRTLRTGYMRRVASFNKKDLVSYAQISLEGSMTGSQDKPLKNMTRNQLILEFSRYSKFFRDETSTEAGIRKVNIDQDRRVFGTDSLGNPLRTMSNEERARFWRLYDEYINQQPLATAKYGSESVQQQLADVMFTEKQNKTIMDILNQVENDLQDTYLKQQGGSVPNVFSGRRLDRS